MLLPRNLRMSVNLCDYSHVYLVGLTFKIIQPGRRPFNLKGRHGARRHAVAATARVQRRRVCRQMVMSERGENF